MRDEKMCAEHVGHHGAHDRQGQLRLTTPAAFALQEAVGDRGQDDVALPAR